MAAEAPTLEVQKEEVMTAEGTERTRARRAYAPRADIYETNDEIVVVADMPGVEQSSVDITIEKNVLNITGYPAVDEVENHGLAYAEYETGDYTRSFTLSSQFDQDHIEAVLRDGVLRLHLPKTGPVKARKISVQAG